MTDGLPILGHGYNDGTQKPGGLNQLVHEPAPLERILSGAVSGLAEADPTSLGKNAGPRLLGAIVNHLSSGSEHLKAELRSKDAQLDSLRADLESCRVDNARLATQLEGTEQTSLVGKWSGLLGGPILGIAGDMYKSNSNTAILLAIIGALVLLSPLLVSLKRKSK